MLGGYGQGWVIWGLVLVDLILEMVVDLVDLVALGVLGFVRRLFDLDFVIRVL